MLPYTRLILTSPSQVAPLETVRTKKDREGSLTPYIFFILVLGTVCYKDIPSRRRCNFMNQHRRLVLLKASNFSRIYLMMVLLTGHP